MKLTVAPFDDKPPADHDPSSGLRPEKPDKPLQHSGIRSFAVFLQRPPEKLLLLEYAQFPQFPCIKPSFTKRQAGRSIAQPFEISFEKLFELSCLFGKPLQ